MRTVDVFGVLGYRRRLGQAPGGFSEMTPQTWDSLQQQAESEWTASGRSVLREVVGLVRLPDGSRRFRQFCYFPDGTTTLAGASFEEGPPVPCADIWARICQQTQSSACPGASTAPAPTPSPAPPPPAASPPPATLPPVPELPAPPAPQLQPPTTVILPAAQPYPIMNLPFSGPPAPVAPPAPAPAPAKPAETPAESKGPSTLAIAGGAGALGLVALLATGVIKL